MKIKALNILPFGLSHEEKKITFGLVLGLTFFFLNLLKFKHTSGCY